MKLTAKILDLDLSNPFDSLPEPLPEFALRPVDRALQHDLIRRRVQAMKFRRGQERR